MSITAAVNQEDQAQHTYENDRRARRVTLVGSGNTTAGLDKTTNSIICIDYEHHEVHSGSHFVFTDAVELGAAASTSWMITTPDTTKWSHIIFEFIGSLSTTFELFEGADRTNGTTAGVGNSNRNSATTAWSVVHQQASGGTTDGTRFAILKLGSASTGGKQGGSSRSSEELVLKQNTKYIMKATSGANANNITIFMVWYEHKDKTPL